MNTVLYSFRNKKATRVKKLGLSHNHLAKVVFLKVDWDPLGSETFSGVCEVKTLSLALRCYSFFTGLTFALRVQWQQVAWQVHALNPSWQRFYASEPGTHRKVLSLENVLGETTKLQVLLNLDAHAREDCLFNILIRGKVHTQHFSADWSTVSVLFRKSLMAGLPAELTFSVEHHFFLKEQLTDKLVSHYYLPNTMKLNEAKWSFQRKPEAVFVASDKIWTFN